MWLVCLAWVAWTFTFTYVHTTGIQGGRCTYMEYSRLTRPSVQETHTPLNTPFVLTLPSQSLFWTSPRPAAAEVLTSESTATHARSAPVQLRLPGPARSRRAVRTRPPVSLVPGIREYRNDSICTSLAQPDAAAASQPGRASACARARARASTG